MYDWPEVAWATDALWRAVAARLATAGLAVPATLDRQREREAVWRDPGLVLSQTCGYPYATRLSGTARLVATPVYAAEGCGGPFYSSVIVARRGEGGPELVDFAGRRFAFNARDSLSGYVALVAAMRQAGLAASDVEWVETGSHRGSVRAVADGSADLAAIDAVCWSLAQHFEMEAAFRLRRVARTPLRPALPFITAGWRSDAEVASIRAALADALASAETEEARKALGIAGIEALSDAEYAPLASLISQ